MKCLETNSRAWDLFGAFHRALKDAFFEWMNLIASNKSSKKSWKLTLS